MWNQLLVNGSEMRNYAALKTWWELRADIIDDYRQRIEAGANILNSRLDFAEIKAAAAHEREATIFTELREHRPVGGSHSLVGIGSRHQRFAVFIRDSGDALGQLILRLLDTRYISGDEDHPRRSYAYLTGTLKLFPVDSGDPEIEITDPDQISDTAPEP